MGRGQLRPQSEIHPDLLYPFCQARLFIPSPFGGPVAIATVRRWQEAGLLTAEFRRVGNTRAWFVRGSELLRALTTEVVVATVPRVRSPSQRERDIERARREMAEQEKRMRAKGRQVK